MNFNFYRFSYWWVISWLQGQVKIKLNKIYHMKLILKYILEPSLSHSLTSPLVKVVGDDALLTCVVQNQQNFTLMWKKDSKEKIGTKILTANTERVTGDPRVSIIHEDGGQVRECHGHNSDLSDIGVYTHF